MNTTSTELSSIRHSLAHLLGAAVLELYPDAKNAIGPAVDNGFYYDFQFSTPISDKDLKRIEKKMRETSKKWKDFSHAESSASDAKVRYADNKFKLELIDEITARDEKITLYTSGDFTDLCRGGHVEDFQTVDSSGWKLSHVAGAYWRGDESREMLTRIYGLAFNNADELNAYIEMTEEAKKRDHKKVGKELDLFTFSPLIGPGLPLWTPKGTVLRDTLDGYVAELRASEGYQRVDIPHITKKDLYEKSGHWDKFEDELFRVQTREGHEFALKPMNCPHHTQIFARKPWSYREMPQRYSSTTKVYRDEQTGELSGLSRVRSITQDDAHVFCRTQNVDTEIEKIWNIIETFYKRTGFGELSVRLSLHDEAKMDKYLGDLSIWNSSVDTLRRIIKNHNTPFVEAPGEAAFYGPKVDFISHDSLGREWQLATIQLDMNMPERFDLFCTNEKGEKERIIMIHAAIMGSIERFIGVLIEHHAGAFPFWLSPVQIGLIPVTIGHVDTVSRLAKKLGALGFRTEIAHSDMLGKSVRQFKNDKTPAWIVVGDRELESATYTIELRDGEKISDLTEHDVLTKFVEMLK